MGAAIEAAYELSLSGTLGEAAAQATITETGQAFTTAFAQTMAVSGVVSAVAAVALLVGHITQTRASLRV